ncbi:HIT family protein [Geomonas silvestris]|uniref:HIT family protein n=1 Tax=Geomonas silvestris TaxID=2740184 RepID=UPI001FE368B9|nr:HIT family protein [Geomonas silvestris]
MNDTPNCLFCQVDPAKVLVENEHAIAFLDAFPVTVGHALVVPRRHVASFFEATPEEQAALFDLAAQVRELLVAERAPDGFNIGINDGAAAGQTVTHPALCRGHRRPARRRALDHAGKGAVLEKGKGAAKRGSTRSCLTETTDSPSRF